MRAPSHRGVLPCLVCRPSCPRCCSPGCVPAAFLPVCPPLQDLVRVSAQHRVLLTGTPLQNSLEELFFLMNFLEPAKFPSVEAFKDTYASLDDKDKVCGVWVCGVFSLSLGVKGR